MLLGSTVEFSSPKYFLGIAQRLFPRLTCSQRLIMQLLISSKIKKHSDLLIITVTLFVLGNSQRSKLDA